MDSLGASSKKRSVDSCACDLGRKQKKKHKRHKGHYEESELTPSSSSESDIYKAKSRKKKAHKKKKKHHKTEKGHESIVVATTSAAAVTSSTIADISKLKATIAAQSAKLVPSKSVILLLSQKLSLCCRPRGPMTKEEYERQQSVVRRVYDPDTGRHRLGGGVTKRERDP